MVRHTLLRSIRLATLGAIVTLATTEVAVADLPPHDPLRILVVGDSVNPHNLPADQLTDDADLRDALAAPQSGINLDGGDAVVLVDSQCVDDALTLLAEPTDIDVVVYFAHRAARRCDNSDGEVALTAAFTGHLQAGGGIVVFHHGIYTANGKGPILQLLGARASSIDWDTVDGQRRIATAPGHFVVDHNVDYDQTVSYSDPDNGIAQGMYDAFVTTPDERYPQLDLLTEGGEERVILFASDYQGGGTDRHVLGYDLQRQGWAGRVVFLQPGEHQPSILDPDGAPFQVLANAVVYTAGALDEGGSTSSTSTTTDGSTTDGGTTDTGGDSSTTAAASDGESSSSASASDGGSEATTESGPTSASAGSSTGVTSGSTGGLTSSSSSSSTTDSSASNTATAGEDGDTSGCACRAGDGDPRAPSVLVLLTVLIGLRGRTRR